MQVEYDLVVIGPLVELQMLTVSDLPRDGGAAVIFASEQTVGCDAPIVAAVVAGHHKTVGIASNAISNVHGNSLAAWCKRSKVKGVNFANVQNPSILGIDSVQTRKRLFLTPYTLTLSQPNSLGAKTKFTYLDWYPEVRSWLSKEEINEAARSSRLWINLARHYDEASLQSLSFTSPELIQVSMRDSVQDTDYVVKKLFELTDVKMVLATFGGGGSTIHLKRGDKFEASPGTVFAEGRSGAGAVFIGTLLSSLMDGGALLQAQKNACTVASLFVGRCNPAHVPSLLL